MVLHDGRRVLAVAFAAALFCAPPASAGILDTIKGLFGGGAAKTAAADDKTITALMDQVEASQKELAAKQTEISSTYNGSISNIKPGDTALQGKLDALQQTSNANSALYLRLLQARADVAKGGDEKALAAVNTRLAQITTTQQSLEGNYQKIQDTNRQAGFFTPTSGPAASEIAGASTGSQGGDLWNDPTAQKAIDEWLTAVHMNQWGQWTGSKGSTTIRSAGSPDSGAGRGRHETVYRMLANDTGHSNMTLAQYVESRLAGDHPEILYNEPAGGSINVAASEVATPSQPVAPPQPTPMAAVAANETPATPAASQIATPSSSDGDADISVVDNQLQGNYAKLMAMQKEGKGTSDDAKALLKSIEGLQAKRTALVKAQGR